MKINGSFVLLVGLGLILWGSFDRIQQDFSLEKPGKQCRVKPGSVYDGDTLRVLCQGEELKLRLCGIDAPERAQPGGMASRDYLRSLLRSAEPSAQSRLPDNSLVRVNPIESDRYDRTVAEVFLGETFINAEMVRKGYAWHYQRYSANCPNRSAMRPLGAVAEGNIVKAAQETQLTGTPPWEFRKQN